MDQTRWQQVTALFDEAMELPAAERDAFVRAKADGDADLQRRVLDLLAAHDRAGDFLETAGPTVAAELSWDPPPLAPGARIGTLIIEREIGRGGMGIVYRARDERLNRAVAVKALSPLLARRDAQSRERLRREAQAAAALSHESIATIYALEVQHDDVFIVSELVEGRTLRERLEHGPLPVREAIDVAVATARGVAAAHARGIVHRDLKPENVIQTDAGVKILDFGIAHIDRGPTALTTLTAAGTMVGTPGYMAPEQLRGEQVDARTDIFALGVLLYELLTGEPPFGRGATPSVVVAVIEREPHPVAERVPDVPPAVAQIVVTALAKSPAARYQSAGALVAALETARLSLLGLSPQMSSLRVEPAGTRGPIWWWRFHLMVATITHALMVIPAWRFLARLPGPLGRGLFLSLLILAATTGIMRLHLRFMTSEAPGDRAAEWARRGPWVRWGTRAFAGLLALGGIAVADQDAALSAVCLACAAGSAVAVEVIEPATAARALRG
jgi:predicted Ser/Thr protein kinase